MGQCLACGGSGRGTFGGPCPSCNSTGQTGNLVGAVQILFGCLFVGFILYAVLVH